MQTLTKKHWIALSLFITIEILRIIYCCSGGYYGVFLALGAIVLSWLIIHFFLHESMADYGLHWKHIGLQLLGALFLAFSLDYLVNQHLIYTLRIFIQQKELNFDIAIHATVEEIVYRGFLLTFLYRWKNNELFAIITSSFIFAIYHYPASQDIDLVLFAFISGFVFSYLRLKEGKTFSLFSLSLAHTIYNTFCM